MDAEMTPVDSADLGGEMVRTLTIVRDLGAGNIRTTEDGKRIYSALIYNYEATDTYNTTFARGAFAHVVPEDFRVLQYHQQHLDPVGKPIAIRETHDGPEMDFVFADTLRAQELETLVAGGFIRGVSVGFIPKEAYDRKTDGVRVFTRADLHEVSLVNTPSSKKALIDLTRELGADQRQVEELYADIIREETPSDEIRSIVDAIRVRSVDGSDSAEMLSTVLSLVGAIDSVADVLMDMISDFLGVENSDEAQDEALEAGDTDDSAESAMEGAAGSDVESDRAIEDAGSKQAATLDTAGRLRKRNSALRRLRR